MTDINAKDEYGMTPLMYAVQNAVDENSEGVVSRLLASGANLEEKNRYGNTALMYSVKSPIATARTTQILLEAGAIVDARNVSGGTALTYAACCVGSMVSLYAKVKFLLDSCADINAKTDSDQTILLKFIGRINGVQKIIRLLLAYGADVSATTEYGDTALKEAVRNVGCGSTKNTIKMLLEAGTDVTMRDNNTLTHFPFTDFRAVVVVLYYRKAFEATEVINMFVENIF